MYSFEEINTILNQMADEQILDPVVEPIDDPSVEVDFWDWADVVGATDDVVDQWESDWYVGQELVDENGRTWYVS